MITVDPARKATRIAQDIDMMQNASRWPDAILHLKTQPWIENRQFGYMHSDDPLVVVVKGDRIGSTVNTEVFQTIEALAERWSVD